MERRATTSASRDRSVNAAFGWDLICRHAASHGIVSVVVSGSDIRSEEVSGAAAHDEDEAAVPARPH